MDVLGLPEGMPVLEIQRLAFSPTDRPVVWAVLHVHPERHHYLSQLWPSVAEFISGKSLA
jgi:DNA-binding GntR family transcriptional regulator